jgi:hypothetical protein
MQPAIALSPANGTTMLGPRRSPSAERVTRAMADFDYLLPSFEPGRSNQPSLVPEPAATPYQHAPSWAPTPRTM